MNPLFVGIDVSSKNNVAYLMKPDGSKHSSFSVQNNLGGAKLLSERIVSALSSMRLSDVVIGLEATSIYGDNLVYALREDGGLGRFRRKIHVLNPKQVKKFKEAYPDLPKNDWVDAFVIADHLRFGRIAKEVYMDDYRYQALRTLTRARFDVIQNLTREKQRFANYLFLKCSGMAQDKGIQNTSATTIALMERFETVQSNRSPAHVVTHGHNRKPQHKQESGINGRVGCVVLHGLDVGLLHVDDRLFRRGLALPLQAASLLPVHATGMSSKTMGMLALSSSSRGITSSLI